MSNGRLVLQQGWEDFSTNNNIMEDDLLVFKYVGDLSFEVFIFDPKGCEKGCKDTAGKQVHDGLTTVANKSPELHKNVERRMEVNPPSNKASSSKGTEHQSKRAQQLACKLQQERCNLLLVLIIRGII